MQLKDKIIKYISKNIHNKKLKIIVNEIPVCVQLKEDRLAYEFYLVDKNILKFKAYIPLSHLLKDSEKINLSNKKVIREFKRRDNNE